MKIEEYKKLESEIKNNYEVELHNLRTEYALSNSEFKVGDFIYSVEGIIKIDEVTYEMFANRVEIIYKGLKYKKEKGNLIRTKSNKIETLKYSLKLMSH